MTGHPAKSIHPSAASKPADAAGFAPLPHGGLVYGVAAQDALAAVFADDMDEPPAAQRQPGIARPRRAVRRLSP